MPTADQIDEVQQMYEEAETRARSIVKEPEERAGTSGSSGLIKYNGKEMPERMPAFRRLTGTQVFLPTVQLAYHMAKRHSDGSKVFVRTQAECLTQPEPIDESCEVCARREIKKRFFNTYDLEAHMDVFHPREWGIQQRDLDRRERQEERVILRALVERGQVQEVTNELKCELCGKAVKSQFGLQAHKRAAHKMSTVS